MTLLQKLKKILYERRAYILIFTVTLLLFAILIKLDGPVPNSDDIIFPQMVVPYHTVGEWVSHRYQTWSGRLLPEALVYLVLPAKPFVWKIITFISYIVFVISLWLYGRLFAPSLNSHNKLWLFLLCCISPLLIGSASLFDGMFWFTGAINYFWVATIGIVGFYPIAHYLKRNKYPEKLTYIGLVCAVLASASHEQIGAVLAGLAISSYIYVLIKYRFRQPNYILMLYTIAILIAFTLEATAPGNHLRMESELHHWLPTFYQVPLLDRINFSYRWFLDAVINQSGVLLLGVWMALSVLILSKHKKDMLDLAILIIIASASILVALKGIGHTKDLFDFYAVWQPTIPNRLGKYVVIPWSVVILATIISPLVLFRKRREGYFLAVTIGAYMASIAIVTLSPTLYVSGWRTIFAPSVLLVVILMFLFTKVFTLSGPAAIYAVFPLLIAACVQYGFLLERIVVHASLGN